MIQCKIHSLFWLVCMFPVNFLFNSIIFDRVLCLLGYEFLLNLSFVVFYIWDILMNQQKNRNIDKSWWLLSPLDFIISFDNTSLDISNFAYPLLELTTNNRCIPWILCQSKCMTPPQIFFFAWNGWNTSQWHPITWIWPLECSRKSQFWRSLKLRLSGAL